MNHWASLVANRHQRGGATQTSTPSSPHSFTHPRTELPRKERTWVLFGANHRVGAREGAALAAVITWALLLRLACRTNAFKSIYISLCMEGEGTQFIVYDCVLH